MRNNDNDIRGLFHRPYKTIAHIITDKGEIERVLSNMEMDDYDEKKQKKYKYDFLQLVQVMQKSKKLKENDWSHKGSFPSLEQQTNKLCSLKSIKDLDAREKLGTVMDDIKEHNEAVRLVTKLALKPCQSGVRENQFKLRIIWKHLNPGKELKEIQNLGWIDVGFQGSNPITDFRGSGKLGLHNIYCLSCSKLGQSLFEVSRTEGYEYFFASVGIYLTVLLLDCLQENLIYFGFSGILKFEDELATTEDQDVLALQRFQVHYEQIFKKFNEFWIHTQDRSFMELNNNLKKFRSKTFKELRSSHL